VTSITVIYHFFTLAYGTIMKNMEPPSITQVDSTSANAAAQDKDYEDEENNESPLIKPISSSSVKRLVAGQAITDLSSSVKELVDNAIDAGATRISIKLYNQGLECIELIDDGHGVPKSSRQYMAQRHATSKLRQFDDIYTAACAPTLGFRGEALFCLANLSRTLKVSTRTVEDETVGESFCFDTQGELIADSVVPTPRSVGTTVSVYGLMESLPVRRVDMCKRIKAQNMKLMKLMQGYAILCMGVQFTLTDVTTVAAKNKKTMVRLATSDSSKTMEARVASVLGTKFLAGLTRIDLDLQSAVDGGDADNRDNNKKEKWSMSGLISHSPTSPNPGNAREMQFFSINGRPVDLPSVSRVIGDVWRAFDPSVEGNGGGSKRSGRRPACVLAFTLPASMYDVNLAPDKREVMFTEETSIIGCIREGLTKIWTEQSEGKFRANEVERRSTDAKAAKKDSNPASKLSVTQEPIAQNEKHSSRAEETTVSDDFTPKTTRRNPTETLGANENGSLVTPFDSSNENKRRRSSFPSTTSTSEENDTPVDDESHSIGNTIPVQHERASPQERRGWEQTQLKFRRIEKENFRQELQRVLGPSESVNVRTQRVRRAEEVEAPESSVEESPEPVRPRQPKRPKRQRNDDVSFLDKFSFGSKQEDEEEADTSGSESVEDETSALARNERISNTRGNLVGRDRTTSGKRMLVGRAVSVTKTSRAFSLRNRRTQQAESSSATVASAETVWDEFSGTRDVILQSKRAYLATKKNSLVLDSSLNKNETKNDVKKETTLSLCKEDIRHMSIIGQFNLGFILARDYNNNIWILDQHACDEKYNFERLCKETIIHEQKLIAPLPLELSPSEEHCVLEHMDIFERNGFRFSYDPDKEQRHRLSVTALPHSGSGGDGKKAVQFGKEDVGALCAMLGADGTSSAEGYIAGFGSGADGSGMVGNNAVRRFAGLPGSHNGTSVMRLPKAIAMFASRACRGSIMIGTALSDKEQKKILNKLDSTDDPWTCAHGRPTMSHVSNVSQQLKDDDVALASYYSACGSSEYC